MKSFILTILGIIAIIALIVFLSKIFTRMYTGYQLKQMFYDADISLAEYNERYEKFEKMSLFSNDYDELIEYDDMCED